MDYGCTTWRVRTVQVFLVCSRRRVRPGDYCYASHLKKFPRLVVSSFFPSLPSLPSLFPTTARSWLHSPLQGYYSIQKTAGCSAPIWGDCIHCSSRGDDKERRTCRWSSRRRFSLWTSPFFSIKPRARIEPLARLLPEDWPATNRYWNDAAGEISHRLLPSESLPGWVLKTLSHVRFAQIP